jgi:hypothetical protein
MLTEDDLRYRAQVMINRAVKNLTGGAVDLSDLADTFNLCAGLDELEELLEQEEGTTPTQELLDVAQDIAEQLLDEEGFSAVRGEFKKHR